MAECSQRKELLGDFYHGLLVNETYIRLRSRSADVDLVSKEQFFALAAQAMRRVLIDHARAATNLRQGNERDVPLQVDLAAAGHSTDSLLDLDKALTELTAKDARQGRLVELIFFAGLSTEEAAKSLGISARTAQRVWSMARAWLRGRLQGLRSVG